MYQELTATTKESGETKAKTINGRCSNISNNSHIHSDSNSKSQVAVTKEAVEPGVKIAIATE